MLWGGSIDWGPFLAIRKSLVKRRAKAYDLSRPRSLFRDLPELSSALAYAARDSGIASQKTYRIRIDSRNEHV
jgi:hypothetical protein